MKFVNCIIQLFVFIFAMGTMWCACVCLYLRLYSEHTASDHKMLFIKWFRNQMKRPQDINMMENNTQQPKLLTETEVEK